MSEETNDPDSPFSHLFDEALEYSATDDFEEDTAEARALTEEEAELFVSIDEWFKKNLPEPEPCKNHEPVITFFKCGSTEQMLQKLRPAIALLDKYKKPYDIVYTNFVGTIVYEDDWQIAVSVKDRKMV